MWLWRVLSLVWSLLETHSTLILTVLSCGQCLFTFFPTWPFLSLEPENKNNGHLDRPARTVHVGGLQIQVPGQDVIPTATATQPPPCPLLPSCTTSAWPSCTVAATATRPPCYCHPPTHPAVATRPPCYCHPPTHPAAATRPPCYCHPPTHPAAATRPPCHCHAVGCHPRGGFVLPAQPGGHGAGQARTRGCCWSRPWR